jgi:outer membrane protein OmpA-like peptidoglycan-associated protein
MSSKSTGFWTGALAGLIIAVAAVPAAVWFWNAYAKDRDASRTQIAELGKRMDQTNRVLAEMQKTASLTGVTAQLEELNGRIKSTNDALAELQKASAAIQRTSLEQIADRLDKLDASLKGNSDAVAGLQKSVPLAGLSKQIGQMQANLTSLDVALAGIKKSAPAADAAKRFDALEGSVQALGGRIGEIKTALESGLTTLADLQKRTAAGPAAPQVASTLDDIKKSVSSSAMMGEKLLASVGGLQDNLQQQQKLQQQLQEQLQQQQKAAARAGMDLVVIHAQPQAAAGASADAGKANGPETPMAPLGFEFKRLGAAQDSEQAGAVVAKVQDLVRGHDKCAISVAGYADTVGSDEFNLDLSKKRAHNVAEQLRAALGGRVQIAETGWGDRRLKVWTPDNTPKTENRRVDIAVHCRG